MKMKWSSELHFSEKEGKVHTLSSTGHQLNGNPLFFSTRRPHIDTKSTRADKLVKQLAFQFGFRL